MSIGLRLREERERLDLSQTKFAAIAGASRRVQTKWEADETSPNAVALAAFANAGVDATYVLTGEKGRFSPKTMAHYEQNALQQQIPYELFCSLRESRNKNLVEMHELLQKHDINLNDALAGHVIYIIELYNIPINQMANLLTSIILEERSLTK